MRTRYGTSLTGLLLLLSSFSHPLFAQSKYAGEPFSIGVGGRGLGMGSAYHTLSRGPESLFWNPAGLARELPGKHANSISLMHSERFDGDVSYNFAGYSRRLERGDHPVTIGLGMIHLGVSGIPVTRLEDPDSPPGPDNRPVVERYVSKNDFAFLAGLGRRIEGLGFVGANLKVLHERYMDVTATGFGFDVGAVFELQWRQPLLVSISARDVTSSFLAYSTGKREYIKPWISAGVAPANGFAVPGGSLTGAFEVSVPVEHRRRNYRSTTDYLLSLVHVGLEYSLQERVFLRTGMDERNPTFGAGLLVSALAVDYAWLGHRDLDQTHRVSMGYSF